jgi:hypothetical protein
MKLKEINKEHLIGYILGSASITLLAGCLISLWVYFADPTDSFITGVVAYIGLFAGVCVVSFLGYMYIEYQKIMRKYELPA